jgi:hypothetical protein
MSSDAYIVYTTIVIVTRHITSYYTTDPRTGLYTVLTTNTTYVSTTIYSTKYLEGVLGAQPSAVQQTSQTIAVLT